MATSPSGKAEVCKISITSSILVVASNLYTTGLIPVFLFFGIFTFFLHDTIIPKIPKSNIQKHSCAVFLRYQNGKEKGKPLYTLTAIAKTLVYNEVKIFN